MKTALGYLFLAFAAMIVGLMLFSILYAATGKLVPLLLIQDYTVENWVHLIGFWVLQIVLVIPLAYYGFKWIKREQDYPSPPTGKAAR